ncbi:MAG: hypothetical protein LKI53_00225 [Bacteroidales bacterium]|jgi:hypothetical protein|nr:hypothetical protein [Bacteroidales bacterium]
MRNRYLILLISALLLLLSGRNVFAQGSSVLPDFRNGDLLFQKTDCGPLCEAIDEVTRGYHGRDFNHVALVWINDGKPEVIEAAGEYVSVNPINKFLYRVTDSCGNPLFTLGRLKRRYRKLIPGAIVEALKLVGKPYDPYYDISNDKYYCSELIYFAFMRANGGKSIFKLRPMTYKSPGTSIEFPVWGEYFKKLNVPVPEGKPGLNPGGISRSGKISIVFSR